jgi:hypothetical protein
MFCKNCGTQIPDDSTFCTNCGKPVGTPVQNDNAEKNNFLDPDFQSSGETGKNSNKEAAPTDNDPGPTIDSDVPAEETTKTAFDNGTIDTESAADNGSPAPTTEAQRASTAQVPPKKGKTALILGIAGGAMALILIVSGIIAFMATKNHNDTPFSNIDEYVHEVPAAPEEATPEEVTPQKQINTIGNTFGNIGCGGIATIQGDMIYFMQLDANNGNDMIMSMDMANTDEQALYSFADDIYAMNAIGNCLYFNGDTSDESGNLISSNIYCYHIDTNTLETIFPSSNCLYNFIVIGNKMYFGMYNTDTDSCDIYSANIDGSDPTWILNTIRYNNSFFIENNSIYYVNAESLYRCDLDGQNSTLIYTSSNSLSAFCPGNSKIYIAEYVSAGYSVITAINMDGSNAMTVTQSVAGNRIEELNVDKDTIYYVDSAYNDDSSEVITTSLCSIQSNGSNQKTLTSANGEIYGTSVCGDWLFYYNKNEGKTIKLNK